MLVRGAVVVVVVRNNSSYLSLTCSQQNEDEKGEFAHGDYQPATEQKMF